MSYRDNLDALAARHAALETEVAQKTRELDQAARLLDEAKAKSKLPVLDNIRIAAPCSAEWAAMTGDERVRHCGDCKKNVYNISELTRDEAEALIVAKEGKLCVRYYQRTDGTILLKDCSIGVSRRRRRRIVAAGAAAMLAGGAALYAKLTAADDKHPVVGNITSEVETQAYAGVPVFEEPPPPPVEKARERVQVKMGGISLEDHEAFHAPKVKPPRSGRRGGASR